ncbi:MAG: sialidase family protein [Verrucomicrobia bacterium]|nr:sialidase family protein [Verrucomicrobiota bacterium]
MKLYFFILTASLLAPSVVLAEEATIRGEPIIKDDFERCTPKDNILNDETRRGFWNLRYKTWGENNMLNVSSEAPDIAYDPMLKGFYDIEVESRATDRAGGFGLRLSSEPDFTVLNVPNEGATAKKHFNVWLPFRKNVRLDNEKLIIRYTGKTTYIDSFKFIPIGRFTKFQPLAGNEPGPSTGVICKQMGRYIGWPTIVRTSKGELIVTFSGDRDAHVCPWGKTQIVRSADNGRTWSDVVTINNTPLDDRDTGIIKTSKGTLLVSWFTSVYFEQGGWMRNPYKQHAAKIGPETRKQWLGAWVRRSEDNGKTWGVPSKTTACAPHGPIQLKDGRLIYVGTGGGPGPSDRVVVEESRDDGVTWQQIAKVPSPASFYADEPHVVECGKGRLVAMFRNEHPEMSERFLGQSESEDGGRTWSMIHRTEMWGYPPHLIRLNDGRLLVVYGHRRKPYGQRACLSYNDGRTWDFKNEIALVDDAPDGDLGYPASAQLGDGTVLTIYYQKDQPADKPSLMATHWRLPGAK